MTREDHQHGDDQQSLVAHHVEHLADARVERARLDHHAERGRAAEDDEDDAACLDAALIQRRKRAEEAGGLGRGRIDGVIRAGNGDVAHRAVYVNLLIVERPGRHDPRQHGHDDDQPEDDQPRIGHLEAFFLGTHCAFLRLGKIFPSVRDGQ